ncbi:hypothetical protein FAVG1_06128 [Fusarium avenaceum]|nr:hypothetical protein FAVG1_06128 [Fusarium avenaceum]
MGISSLLSVILAALVSVAVGQDHFLPSKNAVLSVEVLPSLPLLPSSFNPVPTTVVTVDCLFCSITNDEEPTSVTVESVTVTEIDRTTDVIHVSLSTTFGAATETIICAPQCQTLATVPWQSGESKAAPVAPYPVLTSCITIYNTPIPSSDTWTPPTLSPFLSKSSTSSSCSTTSTNISPWTWPQPETSASTELTSSGLGIPPWTSAETEEATSIHISTWSDTVVYPSVTRHHGIWSFESAESLSTSLPTASTPTEEVSVSEPCTTEITVTMTTTIVETWQSKTPQTITLLRTITTTIETVVVEAYSTSTGEIVVGGTTTETTTVEAVSSGVECSEVGKCCGGCSVTAGSVSVETASSTVVQTYTTVQEYVSSEGGSWVPAESASGTIVPGTDDSTVTESETLTETATVSGSDWESETAGPTSIQTAGAAHVKAAVGIGAIFGLMGLLA